MNAVEFIFALATVFGTSGFWLAWTSFVYKLDAEDRKSEQARTDDNEQTLNC